DRHDHRRPPRRPRRRHLRPRPRRHHPPLRAAVGPPSLPAPGAPPALPSPPASAAPRSADSVAPRVPSWVPCGPRTPFGRAQARPPLYRAGREVDKVGFVTDVNMAPGGSASVFVLNEGYAGLDGDDERVAG